MKNQKKKIVGIIINLVMIAFIISEIIICINYNINNDATIDLFGNKPYISQINFGNKINTGDLIIARNNVQANLSIVCISKTDALLINSNDKKYESKYCHSSKNLGKFIQFIKEPYIIVLIIVITLILSMIYYVAKNKRVNNIEIVRLILIYVIIFITYKLIFYIGNLKLYVNLQQNQDLIDNQSNINNNTINIDDIIENKLTENNLLENDKNKIEISNKNIILNKNISEQSEKNIKDISNENNIKQNSVNNEIIREFKITENNSSWQQIEKLNIFSNEYYKNKIMPGLNGIYEFKIINTMPYNIKYNINIEEINKDNINIKYRLIKNGIYLNNEYQSISEIKNDMNIINSLSTDIFNLEWKWEDSENDTNIGENAENITYNLNIVVLAEEIIK